MIAASSRLTTALVLVVALARVAHAQPATPAIDLFKEGRALAKAGHYAEACDKFRKSQELDPQFGTLFNIAQCEEKIGKLASALAGYREVAAKDTNAQRQAMAAEYQTKLAARVPKLVVQIASPPTGLSVMLDGPTGAKPVEANTPIDLDFGDYTVITRANGYRELSTSVKIDSEGETKTVPVALALVHAEEPARPTSPPTSVATVTATPRAPGTTSHRKLYGVIGVIAGGAVLVTGGVFGAIASSDWNTALADCGGSTKCPSMTAETKAISDGASATTAGNISTGLVIAGGAITAVGAILWLTAPHGEHAVRMTAKPIAHGGALTLGGTF
jgi:hypothetical protein